jgi:V/A-type H+-transporting ATPase subunit E
MVLQGIVEEIEKEKKEIIERLRKEAEEEANRIIENAKAEAEEIVKEAKAKAEREIEALRRQKIASVNLTMKMQMLNAKDEMLKMVYDMTVQRIQEMDTEEKKRILSKIIEDYKDMTGYVYSNKKDEELVMALISGTNLKYGGNIECIGGVLIESEDKSTSLDLTFDSILKSIYESKIGEISKILFGE